MITRMKKVTIVVQEKDREEALTQLSSIGLVHVEHLKEPAGRPLEEIEGRISEIKKALAAMPSGGEEPERVPVDDLPALLERIFRLTEELNKLRETREKRRRLIDDWKIWGDFDVRLLHHLNEKGIWVYLTELPEKELDQLPDDVGVQVFARKGGVAYCGIISDKLKYFYFKTHILPPKRLSELMKDQIGTDQNISDVQKKLAETVWYRAGLEEEIERLQKELEFEQAGSGMGETGKLVYLRGYCPVPKVAPLEEAARKNRWGLLIEDPGDEDAPPSLITNPGWVRIIEPVFNLIDTIPGYREIDSSFVFLLFFSLFFAMLIGDAGYGVIFLIAAGVVQWKLGATLSDRKPLFLLYVLSIATIIWGVLTGTFFGQQWLPSTVPALVPWLRVNNNVIWLCFLIGAVQLSIAHLWNAVRKAPSVLALADIGWICIIWTMFFVAGMFILANPFPGFAIGMGVAGLALIIGFTIPPRQFFKDLAARMFAIFLSVINSFADVVSYIRLFAVGLATVAIADAFNNMAAGLGWSSLLSGFIASVILLFGHTLNMLLGGMAILVHGVRLNVLEFSSHLGNEWSGHKYIPFKGEKTSIVKK
ncbi:MAG: hypothetical protein V1789_07790 [PVC group bacterium]